jgi:predicted alternative tryptophan synthase beta-subunit
MRLDSWYAQEDGSRRIRTAQLAMFLAGAAPLFVLLFIFTEMALGHPVESSRLVATGVQLAAAACWLAACVTSGLLIGARRVAGLLLGALLLGAVIVFCATRGAVRSPETVAAVIVLVLLARAMRAVQGAAGNVSPPSAS